jgi:hypothetical protein
VRAHRAEITGVCSSCARKTKRAPVSRARSH